MEALLLYLQNREVVQRILDRVAVTIQLVELTVLL